MVSPSISPPAPAGPGGWASPRAGATLILIAAAAAYFTGFRGVFVFDDIQAIVENSTIRSWSSAWSPPPGGLTVSGRPLLNVSFAVNHALSGLAPWSYHALNLLIHGAAGLVLFGLVRRTLQSRLVAERWRNEAAPTALAVALLWAVHPLQTQAVTYIVQRAESLMGLFYLLTLYAFLRGAASDRSKTQPRVDQCPEAKRWFAAAVVSCALGMATKEVMVTAPLMVFLFDRTFVAGSFTDAWRRRWPVHVALAATWLPLAWLVVANDGGTRGGTAGFGTAAWGDYVLTQFEAVTRYVGLAIWPHPLALDYGPVRVQTVTKVLAWVPGVAVLVAGTLWALWRRPAAGFLGAWFLGILATTSLVPGVHQMIAEHRLYLPLAAVLLAVVLALRAVAGRTAWWIATTLIVSAAALTAQRNRDYHSVIAIWSDTVAKRPANANAHNNLGNALADAGRLEEAVAEYEAALRLDAGMADARYNLGLALTALGRPAEALAPLAEALRLRPGYAPAAAATGDALADLGRFAEAVPHYEVALRIDPNDADAHHNLGAALAQLNRFPEARLHLAAAVRLRPRNTDFRANLEALGR